MKNTNIFYSILLFCFFLCKIGSFHVFTHQDSTDDSLENCDLCHYITKNDNDDFLLSRVFIETEYTAVQETKIEIAQPIGKKTNGIAIKLQCRPPPS